MPPLPKRRNSHSRSGKRFSKKAAEFKQRILNFYNGVKRQEQQAEQSAK